MGGMNSLNQPINPKFVVKTFAPGWGASVMGTGVLSPIFSALSKHGILPVFSLIMSQVFLVLAMAVALPVLGVTTWKWLRYPGTVKEELANPVKGAMSVTFAGGFLVLAVAFGRAGMELFGAHLASVLVYLFAAIGGVLALYIGLVFLTDIFVRGNTPRAMITGAWFIPPVVTIIVPIALSPMMTAPTALSKELFWLSWIFLGIGSLLYVVVVSTLFYRTATNPLPPPPLAPSLIIGMGPAGLIGFNLLILAEVAQRLEMPLPSLIETAAYGGAMFWGFGLWWGVASAVVIKRGYKNLPFALSWWGFTFPLGAWVVAGINIGATIGSRTTVVISLLGLVFLLIVWSVVLVKTIRGVVQGSIWEV